MDIYVDLVFPPAYAIPSFLLWRPFIINNGSGTRDDILQLYKSLKLAIGDAMKHLPFREVCLRNTHGLHDLMALDTLDSQFVSMLEGNGLDMHLKATAFVPLRARIFLDALVDCRLPHKQDEGKKMPGQGGKEPKLLHKIVHVLDTLQPAKFHWQWVELRLLLNEQAVPEKLEDVPEAKQISRGSTQAVEVEGCVLTERVLIELVLPCMDKSSDDSRTTFASDMLKQMINIEQQINSVTRGASKNSGAGNSIAEGTTTKGNLRKGMRGGNPGLTRRPKVVSEMVPPSPAALRASMSLRIQILLRLFPINYFDRELVGGNIRHTLASVLMRLLGSRILIL